MPLQANIRQINDVVILDLSGRFTIAERCGILRETVKELLANGQRSILLNLAEVTYIDSGGLGELVGSHVTVTSKGGKLKLLNVQKKVSDVLQIVKLDTIFESYTSQSLAILSFESAFDAPAG